MRVSFLLNLPLLALCLINPSISQTQNWQPIHVGDTLNFRLDTGVVVSHTLWIDSIQVTQNGDSVFFLNRAMETFGDPFFYCPPHTVLRRPQFLGFTATKVKNEHYHFTNDSSEFVIYPDLGVGSSWLFDTLNGIQAHMEKEFQDTIFSQVDSVRQISLSSGDTILLTKHFGILRFPAHNGNNYHLEGIENRNLGVQLPTFWDFFDLDVGDKFFYKPEQSCWGGSSRVEILTKMVSGDTVQYDIHEIGFGWPCLQGPPNYFDQISQWTFIDSANHPLNKYPGQVVRVYKDTYNPLADYGIGISKLETIQTLNGRTGKRASMLFYPGNSPSNDTLMYGSCFEEVYAPFLGRTTKFLMGVQTLSEYMIGYIKGVDSVGTIFPDKDLMNPDNIYPLADEWVNVWQETNDQLRVELKAFRPGSYLQIYDLQGRVHFSSVLTKASESIALNSLSHGLYFIRITDGRRRLYNKKLMMRNR